MNPSTPFIRRDVIDVQPWAETCGEIRPLLEERDGTLLRSLAVFGGEYPGGALYTRAGWIAGHEPEVQALTNAIVATLQWIQAHTPEEIISQMPAELVGPDRELYLAALKNTIPMYSLTGSMDPKGAQAVLDVFSQSVPEIANAHIDLAKTYTNKYVEQANAKTGSK